MTASIAGLRFCAIARPAPETPEQSLYAEESFGVTPSCSSTTIDFTPFFRSSGTSRLAVFTSSPKWMSWMPACDTIDAVPSRVMPMKATFCFLTVKIL